MAVQSLVFSVLFVLASLQIGSGLKCYACNSETDESCADPYKHDNKHVKECVVDGQCGKLTVETSDDYFVIRECFNPFLNCELANTVTATMSKTEKVVLCDSCDGDLCNGNGGPSFYLSIPFTVIMLFVTNL